MKMMKKSSIEHDNNEEEMNSPPLNQNVNTINVKQSIDLGDLIKELKKDTKPKRKYKSKNKILQTLNNEQQDIITQQDTPNQPPIIVRNGDSAPQIIQGSQGFTPQPNDLGQKIAIPKPIENFIPEEMIKELEDLYLDKTNIIKTADTLGITLPEEFIRSETAQLPLNPTPQQIRTLIDEIYRDNQQARDMVENITNNIFRPQSITTNITGTRPQQQSISTNTNGTRPQQSITTNTTGTRASSPSSISTRASMPDLEINLEPDTEIEKRMKQLLTPEDDLMLKLPARLRPPSLRPIPEETIKILRVPKDINLEPDTEIEQRMKQLINQPIKVYKPIQPKKDRNLTNKEFLINQLREKGIPARLSENVEDLQKQLDREMKNELNPTVLPDIPIPPYKSTGPQRQRPSTIDTLFSNYGPPKSFFEDVRSSFGSNNTQGIQSMNIPPQTSLLEKMTTKPVAPPQRNLLGQGFSAFSDLLSSSKGARDASAYGGVALGIAQPELLPAIGALETANQALNIIETPVNAIERAIQQRIDNPTVKKRSSRDSYGGF